MLIPQDAPIDPAKYIVGPGDKFLLKIWGGYQLEETLPVLPAGEIILPDYGSVKLAGLSLKAAKDTINQKINRLYKEIEMSFSLVEVRSLRVHLLGDVRYPGLYTLFPTNRLTDLLKISGGTTPSGDLSSILLIEGKDTTRLNLYDYYQNGTLSANPYLREGLIVYVPPLEPTSDRVYLLSSVSKGYIRLFKNENLWDFLRRTRAVTRSEQFQSIAVKREGETLLMESPEQLYDFTLSDSDSIIVSTIADSVYVVGGVNIPGAYPYIPGMSITEYLSLAGGPTSSGSIKRVSVIRGDKKLNTDEAGYLQAGDIIKVKDNTLTVIKRYTSVISPIASIILTAYAIGLFGGN